MRSGMSDRPHRIASDHFEYTPRRVLLSLLIILAGTVICFVTTAAVIDSVCVGNAEEWLPRYPNSEVVQVYHNFIRPFGIGETVMTLESPDPQTEVLRWYRARRGIGMPQNLLASLNFTVRENTETGGSTIQLSSECAWR
jgi:hypothetical protein